MLVARDVEVRVEHEVAILGPVSFEVPAGSLVALMGASGSGKSSLLRVLAGVAEPTSGTAEWWQMPCASVVHALGYVPQRESVHDRLTAREALKCAAHLRLDGGAEVEARVERVLDELGLVQQADILIRQLSGGERRRTACGLELIGDPAALLLDEPTSGLDAVLERRLMELFRRLADHGRAVLVATHATASLELCDAVLVLDGGRLAYRGAPAGALRHLDVAAGPTPPPDAPTGSAETARGAPRVQPPSLPASVGERLRAEQEVARISPLRRRRSFWLEVRVLSGRYLRILTRDRRTLFLLLAQAPLIGVLIAVVFRSGGLSATASPIDAIELVFLLMTGAIWLGVASACREVVKERGLVEREFDVGVRLDAYVLSKALVLFGLGFVQVLWLTLAVGALRPLGIGATGIAQVFGIAVVTVWASTALGLAVSCAARRVDQAAGAVPLLLMPQLLLAGGLIPVAQMPSPVAWLANLIYARWSYAGLGSAAHIGQRLSGYDTSSVLGFGNAFFSLSFGSAAGILVAFTFVELVIAMVFLMRRPPLDP